MDILTVATILGGISAIVYLIHFAYLQIRRIKGFTFSVGQVHRIYRRHFRSVQKDSPLPYVYQQAGKVYNELSNLNRSQNPNSIDHPLIYFIAGWAKDHQINQSLERMSQYEIASGITAQMIAYLHSGKEPKNAYRP